MSKIYRNILLILSLCLFLIGLIFSHPFTLLNSVIILVIHNFLYSLEKFYERIIFLAFNVTFFVFLIGRMTVSAFFNYKESSSNLFGLHFSSASTVNHILISLYISLIFLYFGYLIIQKIAISKFNDSYNNRRHLSPYWLGFKAFSKYFFYFTSVFKLALLLERIKVVGMHGYYETFSTFRSSFPGIFVILGEIYIVAFFAFLACKPRKSEVRYPLLIFILISILSLFSGTRADFMQNMIILIVYFSIREKEVFEKFVHDSKTFLVKSGKWLGKKHLLLIIVSLPVVLIILNGIAYLRGGQDIHFLSAFEFILDFFYAQGVSANVIGYTKTLADIIPDKLYSIGPILEYIENKIVRQYILGEPEIIGQTVERAINGYIFSHTISYLILGDLYLAGVGYGSSFVAELYHDFGYFGIAGGSLIYGMLIKIFYRWLKSNNVILTLITLLMLKTFFMTPRAGTISFFIYAFSPTKLLGIGIIMFGALIVKDLFYKNYKRKIS